MHMCLVTWVIIASENGSAPVRRRTITWTNVDLLIIRPLGTNISEIWIKIQQFSLKKMPLKMSSAEAETEGTRAAMAGGYMVYVYRRKTLWPNTPCVRC